MAFHVDSEVGVLREVIVHEPGLELSRLTPDWVGEEAKPRAGYVAVNLGYSFLAAAAWETGKWAFGLYVATAAKNSCPGWRKRWLDWNVSRLERDVLLVMQRLAVQRDRLQRAVLQAPVDHVFDGVADLVPRSMERLGGFLPGELPRPAGQEEHVGFGGLVLAIAPRNLLDHYATSPALDTPHAVQKENQNSPERNELKTPLRQMIVAGCGLVTP